MPTSTCKKCGAPIAAYPMNGKKVWVHTATDARHTTENHQAQNVSRALDRQK